jgi:Ycf66 protein N-terminus
MLAHILALAVGLGSLAIYLAAFFFPEIHRKNDFIWSGVGLFYALILWVFARRITGGLFLGHVASVSLLGWSVTQTLQLRRQLTPKPQQTEVAKTEAASAEAAKTTKVSLPQRVGQVFKGVGGAVGGAVSGVFKRTAKAPKPDKKSTTSPAPVNAVDAITAINDVIAAEPKAAAAKTDSIPQEEVKAVDAIADIKASIATEIKAPLVEIVTIAPEAPKPEPIASIEDTGIKAVDAIANIKASIVNESSGTKTEGNIPEIKAVDAIAAIKASIITEPEAPKPSEQNTFLMTNQPTVLVTNQATVLQTGLTEISNSATDPLLPDTPGAS